MSNFVLLLMVIMLGVLGVVSRGDAQGNSAIAVTRLKCELAVDPTGIDIPQPRLFWQVESQQRGESQSAYQILVASTPQILNQDHGDLWDSGRVESDETIYIRYTGRPLASSQEVFWKVCAWDRAGQPAPWSPPAKWTMGLLAASDWKAVWVKAATPAESILLRREFSVRPGLRRAIVHVSGLGQYELNLNGSKVGHDLLTPGWTDYRKTILYDTYDVTSMLHDGPNAAGVTLANGMYHVERPPGRFAKFTGSFGEQRTIVHLLLEYSDGTTDLVCTDPSWKTHTGPVTFASIYGGEDFDARRIPRGWDQPGFDDKDWTPAVEAGKADDTLHGQTRAAEAIREIETHRPVKTQPFPDGSIVYDFGQNASFMPKIRVSGPAGSTVRLTPAEVATSEGAIFRNTMGGASRGSSWWQYTKATDEPESWFPQFYYVGGRYLHAELDPPGREPSPPSSSGVYPDERRPADSDDAKQRPTLESIEAIVVHSTAEPVGTFETSNPLLNRIRENVRWAQRSNLVSIITDCPHREKLGWLEQMNMGGPSIRYEFDLARLFAKSSGDMADSQDPDGLIPNIAPEYTTFKGTFRAAAEWGSSFIAVPFQQYEFDGDTDLLRQRFDAMKRYFAYLESKADQEGILSEGLGDWYDLGPEKPGKAQLTPPPVTATAIYFEDALMMARIATALGLPDARDYTTKAEAIRANYLRKFFHADSGTFATNSQCANALPLALGMVEPADRQRVLDALIKNLESNGYGMTAGDIGFRYLLRALARSGRSDVVYKVVTQDAKPGYAMQVKNGETTLTESWDANRGSSHNHFMLGHVTEWFYRDLAGIDPDPAGPGFKKVIIRPQPAGDLTWVEASHTSLHGKIAVRWERNGARFILRVDVPANTTATVYVPARPGTPITEGGQPAETAQGVAHVRQDGDREIFAVQSGRYVFESSW